MATTNQYLTPRGTDRNEKTNLAEYLSPQGVDVNERTATAGAGATGYFRVGR